MEFEQYLEKDILNFLDSKIYKKENTSVDREEEYGLYLTKDYLKELNYALDNDELTRAKKLFDELKTNYSRLPKSSVERKKIYSLLEKMYEKIQNYVKIKEGKIVVIKQGDMEILKDTTETFSSIADRMEKDKSTSDTNDANQYELTKRTSLPIGLDTNKETKQSEAHFSEEEIFAGEKKPRDKNSIAVESNILGSTLKDALEKPKIKEKEYTKKEPEPTGNENTEFNSQKNVFNIHNTHKIGNEKYETRKGDNSEWMNELMNKDTAHFEKVKMHVIDKLLEKIHRKLDEDNNEQNKKIELLRNEILKQVIEELDKRIKGENTEVSNKLEQSRSEILNKIYHEAQSIISSKDNQDNTYIEQQNNNNNISIDESSANKINEVRFVRNKITDQFENTAKTKQTSNAKYSGEELRVVYEQAIYYMFDNKYNEAAKLFKKIITLHPKNKAAHIRLQECIEKQPELSKDKDIIPYLKFNTIIEPVVKEPDTEYNDNLSDENNIKQNINELKNETTLRADAKELNDNFVKDNIKSQTYDAKHKYTDEELHNMYEEAVCTMFQNNYNEAAKIFEQILTIQPENKIARIRLKECKEATNNA